MTAADPDLGYLLAAVARSPDDDTVRLVLADWLEEHAGTVPCRSCVGRLGHIYPAKADLYAGPHNAMTWDDYVAGAGEGWRASEKAKWKKCGVCSGSGRVSN